MQNFGAQVWLSLRNEKVFYKISFGCIFFAFAEPFGSFVGTSITSRISFWTPVFLLVFINVAIAHAVALHGFRIKTVVMARIIGYVVFTGLFTPMFYAFLFLGHFRMEGGDPPFLIILSWVALTAGTCTAIFALISPDPVLSTVQDDHEYKDLILPRLCNRIDMCSKKLSITRLTVNDHYVLVGLSDGSEQRLLMRLSDAIAEMDEVIGYVTHRSHWVSKDHIKGVSYVGRREMLELSTGIRVPVSRTYRPALVAAGVIPQGPERPEIRSQPQFIDAEKEV